MNKQKKIKDNIQLAINRWKSENNVNKKLDTIKLNKYEDFDCIKHNNLLIEFPPGMIGDKMWSLQYQHNSSLISKNITNKNPSWAPETYIIIKKDLEEIKKIDFYVDDFLIDSYSIYQIYLLQQSFNLTPLTYNNNSEKYDKKRMIFLNFYKNIDNIKRIIKYNDNTSEIIKNDDIYILEY